MNPRAEMIAAERETRPLLTAKRLAVWCCWAALLTALLAAISPVIGEPLDLARALRDFSFDGNYKTADGLIFWQTRLPRVLAGLVAGAGLACSGVAYQAVLRNPLADPYILGVSSGAAIGKAVAVLAVPATFMAWLPVMTPALCFVGALLPVMFLARLARSGRRFSPVVLLLAGAIINLVLSAAMMLVQVFANPDNARQITYWWLGGLDVTGYWTTLAVLPVMLLCIGILAWRSRVMNLLSVDMLTASHLGVNVGREVTMLLGAGTVMAAAAVALCGPIGFAGLLVPHILRQLAGPDHRLLVPLSAIAGAGFLVGCDILGRRGLFWMAEAGVQLHSTSEIPAGVITALLGGPLFLALLARDSRT